MSTNISRRMYLNSNDGDSQDTLNNNKIFHVGDAEFKSDPNQTLGLAIVKAVLPSTIGSLPATNKDGDLSMFLLIVSTNTNPSLHFRVIFNSNNKDLPNLVINVDPTTPNLTTTFVNKYYNITPKTTPKDIIGIINEIAGETVVTLDPESLLIGSNRIALADATGTSDIVDILGPINNLNPTVPFPYDPATLRMLGAPTGQTLYNSPTLGTVVKYELNPGSALSAVQVRTQFNCGSFSSCNNGVRSILGEVPVIMSNSMATNQVLSSVTNLVTTDYQTDAQIVYQNMSLQGAHKNIKCDTVTNIDLTLTNADGGILNLLGQTYYLELEVISIGTF